MSVTSHLTRRLSDLLEEHRIVVWYDRESNHRVQFHSGFGLDNRFTRLTEEPNRV